MLILICFSGFIGREDSFRKSLRDFPGILLIFQQISPQTHAHVR